MLLYVVIGLGVVLPMLILGYVIYRPLLTFRPFDYWRIIYWHVILAPIMLASVWVGASIEHGEPIFPDLGSAMVAVAMATGLVLLIAFLNGHGLKKMSELYERREQKLAEQRQRQEQDVDSA